MLYRVEVFDYFTARIKDLFYNQYQAQILSLAFLEDFIERCEYFEYIGKLLSDYVKGSNQQAANLKKKIVDKIRDSQDWNKIFYAEIVDKFMRFKTSNSLDAKFEEDIDYKSMKLIINMIFRNIFLQLLDFLYEDIQIVIIYHSLLYEASFMITENVKR